jgi:hypothetical protein
LFNQRSIRNHRFSTLALIKAVANANDKTIAYCDETETLYKYDSASGLTANDTSVLATGAGGTTRWEAIAGQYALRDEGSVYKNQSTGESTTTDGTIWQQKLRLTFIPPVAGDYEIHFACAVINEDSNVLLRTRIQIDDTTTRFQTAPTSNKKYAEGAYVPVSGVFYITSLSAASHNIDLDYISYTDGKIAYIKDATIIARRV